MSHGHVEGDRAHAGGLEEALLLGVREARHRIHLVGPGKLHGDGKGHESARAGNEHTAL
jgi:hypothetical protein